MSAGLRGVHNAQTSADRDDVRPESVVYNERATVLQHVWIASRAALRRVMDAVTIADLSAGRLPEDVRDLTLDSDAWEPR